MSWAVLRVAILENVAGMRKRSSQTPASADYQARIGARREDILLLGNVNHFLVNAFVIFCWAAFLSRCQSKADHFSFFDHGSMNARG